MNKTPFMVQLEEKLRPEERIFKFRSAELSGKYFTLELLVNHSSYDKVLDDGLKDKVLAAAKEIVPSSLISKIKYVKASTDADSVIRYIIEYVFKSNPSLYQQFSESAIDVKIEKDTLFVSITLEKFLYEYAVKSSLKEQLENYLEKRVMEDVTVEIYQVPNSEEETEPVFRAVNKTALIRTVEVNVEKFFCGNSAQLPRYICDVKGKEASDVCLCGIISNVKRKYIEKLDKDLYTFLINDTTGSIKVKYFEKKIKNVNWQEVFTEGKTLIMQGQIKFDTFDSEYEFSPRSIAEGTVDYSSINIKSDYHTEPAQYIHVFPQKITEGEQNNFFAEELNPEFKDKVFVVFDLETTGTDPVNDRIIEVCGVKLINGEICESFHTLVDPQMPIPVQASEVNHITDDMVAGQFTVEEILGDFYKFTRGTILVAQNAPFDMGFLRVNGNKYKYDFDNSFADTLVMARRLLNLKKNDLGSLCKYFNINLTGAHRALNDAVATAKLFVKLMNMEYSKNKKNA